jgi:hypothetical protein
MRRKHLQLLAHGSRAFLLGICGIAGGTAAVWTWKPDWVDAVDDACVRRYVTRYRERFDAISREADAGRKARAFEALLDELAWVRRQDRLADIVDQCFAQLSALAEAGNDLTAAVDWMTRRVEFDDHDLLAAARLGALECRVPGRLDAGLQRLQQLVTAYPGHPTAVVALATAQADAGRPADAAATVQQALGALRSNLWTISWDAGTGIHREERRVETVPMREGDEQVFRFRIAEPLIGLAVFPPAFHSGLLEQPRLEHGGAAIELAAGNAETFQLRAAAGRAATTGESGPALGLHWDTPIPADTPLVLRWRDTPLPELAYADALLHPAVAAWLDHAPAGADPQALQRLRCCRARAALVGGFQLFWSSGDTPFSGERHATARTVPVPLPDGGAFALTVPVAATADRVRVDLPDGVGVGYAFTRFDVRCGDRVVPIDLASVPLLLPHGVERRDGRLVVTDGDPYFAFALPEPLRIDRIECAGASR